MMISEDLHQLEGLLYLGTKFFSLPCVILVIIMDISVGTFKSTERGGELVLDNFNLNHLNKLLHI